MARLKAKGQENEISGERMVEETPPPTVGAGEQPAFEIVEKPETAPRKQNPPPKILLHPQFSRIVFTHLQGLRP